MGNDFLMRHNAVINFEKWVLELNNEVKPIRVSLEWVLERVRISGIRVIQNRVSNGDTEISVNVCRVERVGRVRNRYGRRGHISFVVRVVL